MKLAVISMHTCPLAMLGGKKSGGMNVYVRSLAKTLGSLGHEVDVFTRLQTRCQPQISEDLGENVRVVHLEAGPYEPLDTVALADYVDEFASAMIKFVADEQGRFEYDLIHSHYWLSGLVAEELNRAIVEPIPVVQMFHTLGHLKNKYAVDAQDIVSPVRLTAEEHIVKSVADSIVAATENESQELVAHYGADPRKIQIVPPGVDLDRFTPRDADEAKTEIAIDCGEQLIVFAGRIEKLKGIDTLLRAMDILDEKRQPGEPKCCVVIVGGDPWADNPEAEMVRLQKLTEDLEIQHKVAFVGAKDQFSLPNYFAAAEVVVVPSHYESFGMVALEAMAMGKPVIASEVGGLADLVVDGKNGRHVPSRDANALASVLAEVLADDPHRQALGSAAKERASNYSWQNVTSQILDVYNTVLSPIS